MKTFFILAAGLCVFSLGLHAADKASQVQIQVESNGEKTFSINAPCNQIKGVTLVDEQSEILTRTNEHGTLIHLKVAFKPPQLSDSKHRGKPICSGRCPADTSPLPLSSGNPKQYVLACMGLVN